MAWIPSKPMTSRSTDCKDELFLAQEAGRDPNDDMVIACGIKVTAKYIVTRDKDLLDLKELNEF